MIVGAKPSSLTGVGSKIEEYNPYYSAHNGTGTEATVMLVDRSSPYDGLLWAQFGWTKSQLQQPGLTKRQTYTKFYGSGVPYRNYWPAELVGNLTNYKILYTAPYYYDFYRNGVWQWSEDAYSTPEEYQVFGETHDLADQMPGTAGDKLHFNAMHYFTGTTHSSHSITKAMAPSSGASAYYAAQYNSSGDQHIWDRC